MTRSSGGYRLYDAGSVARLELIRTLRELGLDSVDPEFRAQMRLVRLAGEARERGIAPEAPEAQAVLREVLGDGDPAAVLARMKSASNDRLARYRELLTTVKGVGPAAAHREEFAWVVVALRARVAS